MSKHRPNHVESIFDEAFRKVSAIYPEAEPHGRLFHWEWVVFEGDDVHTVAEAWPASKGGGWLLRIKERKIKSG